MRRLSAMLKMLLLTQRDLSTQHRCGTYNMQLLYDQKGCVRV